MLWTRVSGFSAPITVNWKIANDQEFADIVGQGHVETSASRDYTVNIVADKLRPGQSYFYQFSVAGTESPPGQTKTLPTGHLDQLVLAIATCSNFPFGYFNAYDAIGNDTTVDAVVHLGDYIYEYDENGYGGETGKRIGRIHEPRHETVSLADYRQRHAQYKADAGSMTMHARHPLIAIWDDHESANNPWMGGAQNHQSDEGEWEARRRASLQAYFEWMPVRPPAPGSAMQEYWRHYKFGDLVSLITLESRHTGRSKQIEYGDLDRFTNAEEAQAYYKNVIGAGERNFLSADMENFLATELRESVATKRRWRVIGNQSVIAKSVEPDIDSPYFSQLRDSLDLPAQATLDHLTRLGKLGVNGDLDSWSGYPAARERFYQLANNAGARDLLVLAGDSHSFWANELYMDDGQSMGVELGSTGVTSPRSLLSLGLDGLRQYDTALANANREIVWADGRHRGYIRLDINHDSARADFVAISNIESREYNTAVVHTANISSQGGSLRYV